MGQDEAAQEMIQSVMDSQSGEMEVSCEQVQDMLDQILGEKRFDFSANISELLLSDHPGESILSEVAKFLREGLASTFQDQRMIVSLLMIALIGAVFTNFSKLLRGRQVAQMAFFSIYLLFFSVLSASFLQTAALAEQTMEYLLDFMKVLVPTFCISLGFTQGGAAAGAYYEFALIMITVVNWVLVKFALPAIHIYFFLRVINYLAEEDMFSKMAELIRDVVKLVMKSLFGIVMGMNVIQGLIVPVTAQVKNMTLVRAGGAIPGIGNTVSSVAQSILCAGKLVKNSVGVAGLIAVFLICALPLLHMVIDQLLYQLVAAAIQPVSDKRLVKSIGSTVEAMRLLVYAVGMGAMLFVTSIAIISAMTSTS